MSALSAEQTLAHGAAKVRFEPRADAIGRVGAPTYWLSPIQMPLEVSAAAKRIPDIQKRGSKVGNDSNSSLILSSGRKIKPSLSLQVLPSFYGLGVSIVTRLTRAGTAIFCQCAI
jgi:hypothetical protein